MQKTETQLQNHNSYAPVVSVVGHVDHGKTTLLDTIRKTNITKVEAGGITQKIGASYVEIPFEGKKRKITFIDTPGHEAFSSMRARGVSASDLVLLVVAADDGVMPQTRESIQKIQEAKVPFIVVVTKADAPGANLEKVKQQLLKESILLEGLGGDVPYIAVSAKTGERIQDLLDLILLVYDFSQIKKDENTSFYGVVIESRLDKKRGNVATVVVKEGKLKQNDTIYTDKEVGKVRALLDTFGSTVKEVFPGDAVEIIGLKEILPVGSVVYNQKVEKQLAKTSLQAPNRLPVDLSKFFAEEEAKALKIVLKTQSKGEIEAVKNSLPDNIEVVFEAQGDINSSDVLLAKDFGGIIIGFNVEITKDAKSLADNEKVLHRTYSIIYELLDELGDVAQGLIDEGKEVIIGKANIIASFSGSSGMVLGVNVIEGRLAINDKIRILRGEKEIGVSRISSLKRGKQDIKEVAKNLECGVLISPFIDFSIGDMIISYR